METHKRQHIISKTYLKNFTHNNREDIFVIDRANIYNRRVQKRNSGSSIFWEDRYSDSDEFIDPKAIEKFFGNHIEPKYDKIIRSISDENINISNEIKRNIIEWLFYTKLRSPIWEPYLETKVGELKYKDQVHLENFLNKARFQKSLESFTIDAMNKRWTVYKNEGTEYWLTSDNPGYCINVADLENNMIIIPDPFYYFTGANTVLFYPLSKHYCLSIHAYESGTPNYLNLTNTPIKFEQSSIGLMEIINNLTLISRARLVISSNESQLLRTIY